MSTAIGFTPFIAPSVVFVLACAGAIYKHGKLKTDVDNLKEVVIPEGEPKLVSKAVFDLSQKNLSKKIDGIDTKIEGMETKRDTARGEIHSELQGIAKFLGRVEQYMIDHNAKGE